VRDAHSFLFSLIIHWGRYEAQLLLGEVGELFRQQTFSIPGWLTYYVGEVGENFGELAEYGAESGEVGDRAIGEVGLYWGD
jgi:hypothetical protein